MLHEGRLHAILNKDLVCIKYGTNTKSCRLNALGLLYREVEFLRTLDVISIIIWHCVQRRIPCPSEHLFKGACICMQGVCLHPREAVLYIIHAWQRSFQSTEGHMFIKLTNPKNMHACKQPAWDHHTAATQLYLHDCMRWHISLQHCNALIYSIPK